MEKDNTTRFSNRVENYVLYRPHYPVAIIDYLEAQKIIAKGDIIVDIGSGTGISSSLFLDAGYQVTGIEPNKEMREKSIALLGNNVDFKVIDATAESTNLRDSSIDIIVAGQSFHWFDAEKVRIEFERILKPRGVVLLIWNERLALTDFEKEYEQLILTYADDYIEVKHRNINPEKIQEFFYPAACVLVTFSNSQQFEFKGLKGRLLSSSYMPVKGAHGYKAMLQALQQLYNRYNENDTISLHYETKVYIGSFRG